MCRFIGATRFDPPEIVECAAVVAAVERIAVENGHPADDPTVGDWEAAHAEVHDKDDD